MLKNSDQLKFMNTLDEATGPLNVTFSDEAEEQFTTIKSVPDQNGFETVTIPLASDAVYISAPNFEFVERKISTED